MTMCFSDIELCVLSQTWEMLTYDFTIMEIKCESHLVSRLWKEFFF